MGNKLYNINGQLSPEVRTADVYDENGKNLDDILADIGTKPSVTYDEVNYFGVEVHTKNPFNYKNMHWVEPSQLYDTDDTDTDYCVLRLPKGHKSNSEPLKLVLYFHGSGEPVYEDHATMVDHVTTLKIPSTYFVASGYAVLATNGLPKKYSDDNGLSYGSTVGNWMSIESTSKAVDYVCKNFNIDKNEIYVYGESQGGMAAMNYMECGGHKVKAAVIDSGAMSMLYAQAKLSTASANIQHFYGFNSVDTYDATKCVGLDPFTRNCSKVEVKEDYNYFNNVLIVEADIDKITSTRTAPCPIKFFVGSTDYTVPGFISQIMAKQMKNNGLLCECDIHYGTTHCIDQRSAKVATFEYNEKTYDLSQPEIDMALWFARFGGNKIAEYINL